MFKLNEVVQDVTWIQQTRFPGKELPTKPVAKGTRLKHQAIILRLCDYRLCGDQRGHGRRGTGKSPRTCFSDCLAAYQLPRKVWVLRSTRAHRSWIGGSGSCQRGIRYFWGSELNLFEGMCKKPLFLMRFNYSSIIHISRYQAIWTDYGQYSLILSGINRLWGK